MILQAAVIDLLLVGFAHSLSLTLSLLCLSTVCGSGSTMWQLEGSALFFFSTITIVLETLDRPGKRHTILFYEVSILYPDCEVQLTANQPLSRFIISIIRGKEITTKVTY